MKNTVSVIIAAYNAEKTIKECLEGVMSQDYENPFEIIVVDDGSTDNTARIAQSFPQIIYYYQDNAGPAAARNKGFSLSSGDLIFFTDCDCIPENDWVSTAVRQLTAANTPGLPGGVSVHTGVAPLTVLVPPHPIKRDGKSRKEGRESGDPKDRPLTDSGIDVLAGSYSIANTQKILARCIQGEITFRHTKRMKDTVRALGSYNCCIRRSVFEKIGGFNVQYRYPSGEDNDLSYRLINAGYTIHFNRRLLVKHFHPSRILRYLKEQKRHGFWRLKMYKNHPRMMRGDDYTFWKDAGEVLLVLCILSAGLLFFASLFFSCKAAFLFGFIIAVLLACLLGIELYFSILMVRNFREICFWWYVMSLRSFARCYGFISGALHFKTERGYERK